MATLTTSLSKGSACTRRGGDPQPGSHTGMNASRLPLSNEQASVVETIAATLGESEKRPLEQLRLVTDCLGPEKVLELLAETEQVEVQGGMLVPDGSRRRTPGGVFFALARRHLSNKDRHRIFGIMPAPQKRTASEDPPPKSSRRPIASPRRRFVEVSAIPRQRPVVATGVDRQGADKTGHASGEAAASSEATLPRVESPRPPERRRRIVTIADLSRRKTPEEASQAASGTSAGEDRKAPRRAPFAAELEARFGGVPKTRSELRKFIRALLADQPVRERQRLILDLLLDATEAVSSSGRRSSLRAQWGVLAAHRLGYSTPVAAELFLGDRTRRARQDADTIVHDGVGLALVEQLLALREQD